MKYSILAITTLGVMSLAGCADSREVQDTLKARYQTECLAKGLEEGSPEYRECFAKAYYREHQKEPGARHAQRRTWQHYLD